MATLNTVRAILRDVHMREQAAVIQKEVGMLLADIGRLNDRVGNLDRHFDMAQRDIDQIKTTTGKIASRSEKIEAIEVEDTSPVENTLKPILKAPLSPHHGRINHPSRLRGLHGLREGALI